MSLVRLRDTVEQVVRTWGAHEAARGGRQVIDFDCAPPAEPVPAARSRLEVYHQLKALSAQAKADDDQAVQRTLQAHLAYLGSVLGDRPELNDYMLRTQGCPAAGWPEDYVVAVGDRARKALTDLGVTWGPTTGDDIHAVEDPIDISEAQERVQVVSDEVEPIVRALTGTTAPFTVNVEVIDIDDYWSFWVDGAGSTARLRFNARVAVFTDIRLRQFAQHELLGHALQCASFTQTAATENVDWVRTLTVHLPYQTLLEGLATAWPMFTTPEDVRLMARSRVTHYLHLVRSELHRAINSGASIDDCADHARARVPWFTDAQIGNILSDRGTDPLLRSYLWAYPAGTDWFMNLADQADAATIDNVLRAAYRHPLTPADLQSLWPTGPAIGGPGAPIQLRKPVLS
jgi:hypothetical protein